MEKREGGEGERGRSEGGMLGTVKVKVVDALPC